MRDLATLNKTEQNNFFDSFDDVLVDIDGVIWFLLDQIPGGLEAMLALKRIGKRIIFVSNNSLKSVESYLDGLYEKGFDLKPTNLVIPLLAIIDYLKTINFNKEAYVIAHESFKQSLIKEGINVYQDMPPYYVEENIQVVNEILKDDERIGAVIVDMTFNMNWISLQKALTCLKRKDCLFITGASDAAAPAGPDTILIGPKYYHDALEDLSKRKKQYFAKPGTNFNDYIVKRYNIKDRSRVLFIGDSVFQDMGFATNCGYQKLLVLSGLTKKEDLSNWKWPEEFKPDYYADSVKVIADILEEKQ